MRGALHLLTPEEGGSFLSLMAAGRSWERPSWQRYFGVTPTQIDALRGSVRETLDGRVLTREELVGAVGLADTPGALDPALWSYGKWGCTFCQRAGRRMPISTVCVEAHPYSPPHGLPTPGEERCSQPRSQPAS